MKREVLLAVLCCCFYVITCSNIIASNEPKYYEPKWSSLETRPLPDWFDKAKIGVFIHWGVYSVPSFGSEWFWMHWKGKPSPNPKAQGRISNYMTANYKPGFSYEDFATHFTIELFDPAEWASLIEASGAKYVVFTSKHHDGYAMWPSNYSYSWNSVAVGPHKDINAELAKTIREKTKLKFGFYYSLYEWFHPLYLADKTNNFTTQTFVDYKILPEMRELVDRYKPEVIWSDGEWEAPSKYWKAEEFLAWLYNESPVRRTVVVNDRWGKETLCKHGGYFTCADRFAPGKLLERKWENALSIDKGSWGYSRLSNLNDYLTTQQLIDTLVQTVAFGGNVLMNIGPTKYGKISQIYQERLIDVGKWLKVNGDAIYESSAWNVCQNDTNHPSVWYTTKNDGKELYIIILRWPKTGFLYLSCLKKTEDSEISMLGLPDVKIKGTLTPDGIFEILLPNKGLIETNWGWTIKMSYT
ncbi:alpha-L-fucosidase [Halyomorpha halys]|uniref:alpha-L-fucosidase n=1 Tax=Halyomorpha halys TaxID=286706 RepID=UPI0006D50C3A|nr:alpha-L-fucosidase-like [Halyomorpha halys]